MKRRRKNTTRRLFFPIRHPIYSSIRHIMRALIQKMPKSYTNKWLNRLPTIVRLKIAKTYSNMKPQEAASIFDTMTDNLGLVADILMNMGTQQRADILGKMDATTAAKLTEIMEPTKKK